MFRVFIVRNSSFSRLGHFPGSVISNNRVFSNEPPEKASSTSNVEEVSTSDTSTKPGLLRRFWSGKSKSEIESEALEAGEEQEWRLQEQEYARLEAEQKRLDLQKKRNKSRLRASDRRMLYGQPPLAGIEYEMNDRQRSQEFKQHLLGLYGSRATGISPRVAWMTKEDLDEKREWEKVELDDMNLQETIEYDLRQKKEELDFRLKREREIDENLAKMADMMKQFQNRKKISEERRIKEMEKKQRILADLREEYGYDVDPTNPLFSDKYAEKEKEYNKLAREQKKARVKELKELEDKNTTEA